MEPTTKFIKVRCAKCKNEQIVFDTASKEVHCLVCDEVLAQPTGGKAKISARVLEVLE
ncbi:30S ribosomal protein S27e [Candidatus Woesearchaeota archaeon]|jgi:small subunit ribosomal protein S27e|nr:30S ribosomal protein S27e [Candidatus Woesearchaeota archaeon]MBT5739489.1 30S ribosomal protein S27e [Candidatus Woesearchaeota archaeon]